jgi:hypothetical protein
MVPLGLWIGIIGYGILFAGGIKLAGGTCTIGQAFRGQCKWPTAAAATSSTTGNSSTTPVSSAPISSAPGGAGNFQP